MTAQYARPNRRNLAVCLLAAALLFASVPVPAEEPMQVAPPIKLEKKEKKFPGRVVEYPKQSVAPGQGVVMVSVLLPRKHHFADEAPSSFVWRSRNDTIVSFPKTFKELNTRPNAFPLAIPIQVKEGQATIEIDASAYFCADKSKVCQLDYVRVVVPIEVKAAADSTIAVRIEVGSGGDEI